MNTPEPDLVLVGILALAWCFFHSLLVTHAWDRLLRRLLPGAHPVARAAYVAGSSVTLLALMIWIRTLDEHLLWDWPGRWAFVRWAGLGVAGLLFWLGARAFDGRAFLGLSQLRAWRQGKPAGEPPFQVSGILAQLRNPWYGGALLFFLCCLPYTDVNLVWRAVFFGYTLVGTELEERKLLKDLGSDYAAYRSRVPRFFPRLLPRDTRK